MVPPMTSTPNSIGMLKRKSPEAFSPVAALLADDPHRRTRAGPACSGGENLRFLTAPCRATMIPAEREREALSDWSCLRGRAMRMPTLLLLAFITIGGQLHADDESPSIQVTKDDHLMFLGGEMPLRGSQDRYDSLVSRAFQQTSGVRLNVTASYSSSNTLPDVQQSLDRHFARNPTLVVLFTGTNDIRYDEKQKSRPARRIPRATDPRPVIPPLTPEQFTSTLTDIVDRCTKAGVRVLLCTPAVIGEKHDGSNPLDATLDEYAELTRKFAREHKVALCDLRQEFIQYEKGHNPENNHSGILTSDGTKLSEAGHRFQAEVLMMHLGIEPAK